MEVVGQSEDEAIEKILTELGVDRKDVDIEIVEKKKQGLLSLNKEYKVKISANKNKLKEALQEFLENVLKKMELDGSVAITFEENIYTVEIDGEDLGLLVGKHGETIQALQNICFAYLSKLAQEKIAINLDVGGYFKKRQLKLTEIAKNMAEKVATSGKSIALKPMSAKERRVIHLALKDSKDVVTASEGEEPYRQVLIIPRHYN